MSVAAQYPASLPASLLRAVTALAVPAVRRVAALGLGLSVLCFALLWLVAGAALYHSMHFGWRPLDWLAGLLGGVAVLGLTWLLFPAVATLIMGFFLDRVAAAVEALDYPQAGPPRRQAWGELFAVTGRLAAATLVLNLLALPLYLLAPGINLVLFLALNGYLFGRGYFEVAALRRLDAAAAKALRRRFAGRIFLGGVMIAGLFAVPFVNLVTPAIATAFMVHVFHALPRKALLPAARSAI